MDNPGQNDRTPEQKRFISVRGLCRSFNNSGKRVEILKGVDLDLDAGETLAVTGPSGIGKSTLLHLLGALDRPDGGAYFFCGEDVFGFESSRLAKFRNESVGFVFQFHYLLSEFSAVENVMMPALIRGMSKKKAQEAGEALLVRVGLKDRMHFRVARLSGGEQQRVALARALVLKPTLLLADEPTGNLDKKGSEQVHELIMELNREFNVTLVVVTHNMELASLMLRRATIIDGTLVELGA